MTKVMLCEDDQGMQGLLKTLLEIEGYKVVQAGNHIPGGVIQQVKEEKPDILVMDVHLNKENGLDIIRKLRQDGGLNRLHVIMMSGMALGPECIEAGADSFVLKPFMPDELLKKLKEK